MEDVESDFARELTSLGPDISSKSAKSEESSCEARREKVSVEGIVVVVVVVAAKEFVAAVVSVAAVVVAVAVVVVVIVDDVLLFLEAVVSVVREEEEGEVTRDVEAILARLFVS